MNTDDRGPLSKLLGHTLPPIPHVRPVAERVQKLSPETLANGRVNEQPVDDAATVLIVPAHVSLVALGRAFAQFGMHMKATTDGRMSVEYSELSRDDVLRLNRENARDHNFMPPNGMCWSCSADILEQYSRPQLVAGYQVTGCRKCHRSFCE